MTDAGIQRYLADYDGNRSEAAAAAHGTATRTYRGARSAADAGADTCSLRPQHRGDGEGDGRRTTDHWRLATGD